MSFVSVLYNRVGDWSSRASLQLPSRASGFSGEASESEGGCTSVAGLRGNTESVSEYGLWLDGEQHALDNRVAFRFSAGKQKQQCYKCAAQSIKWGIEFCWKNITRYFVTSYKGVHWDKTNAGGSKVNETGRPFSYFLDPSIFLCFDLE